MVSKSTEFLTFEGLTFFADPMSPLLLGRMPVETVKTGKELRHMKYCTLLEKSRYRREPSNAVGVYHLLRTFLTFLLTRPFVVDLRPRRLPFFAFPLAMVYQYVYSVAKSFSGRLHETFSLRLCPHEPSSIALSSVECTEFREKKGRPDSPADCANTWFSMLGSV